MPLVNGKVLPLELPKKHAQVLLPKLVNGKKVRFRGLHGGRNGGKDWAAYAVAIEKAVRVPTRVLCTREIQKTIKDSCYQLIVDTITRLGYSSYFTVLDNEIRGPKGSKFVFTGLRDLNADNIKSMEGIDLVIIGEAQNLTQKSADILFPTIRKAGSEIWIIFNDQIEADYVYQLCVSNPPDNMICAHVNYTDLPPEWLTPEVIDQASRMAKNDYPRYEHIWLGKASKGGRFFTGFGDHNKENAFTIPDEENSRLFAGLDHGIAHDTVFALAWLDDSLDIHNILTYKANGMTTRDHAEAICDLLEACRFSRYYFPCEVFYDYAMDTKKAISQVYYRSDLDEYKEVFQTRKGGVNVRFIPANKRKVDGCNQMRQVFDQNNGRPIFRYFDGMNEPIVTGIKAVIEDEGNTEIYAKLEGDDVADALRYMVMGVYTHRAVATQAKTKKASEPMVLTNTRMREMFVPTSY